MALFKTLKNKTMEISKKIILKHICYQIEILIIVINKAQNNNQFNLSNKHIKILLISNLSHNLIYLIKKLFNHNNPKNMFIHLFQVSNNNFQKNKIILLVKDLYIKIRNL